MSNVKTREKVTEGWVYDSDVENGNTRMFTMMPDNFHSMTGVSKAKLIIYEPEKTVTISESEFTSLYIEQRREVGGFHNPDLFEALKQKLFCDK